MEVKLFLLGVAYGVGAVFFFFAALFVSGVALAGERRHLYPDDVDPLGLIGYTILHLGVLRTLLWVCCALIWPPLLAFSVILFFFYIDCEELPPPMSRMLAWIYLGFGKYVD